MSLQPREEREPRVPGARRSDPDSLPGAGIIELKARRERGRPKVRSDEQQRDVIVSQATQLFLKSGFVAMRMDDVAAQCGMSKRTLYRLFPSKLDLFRAMVEMHRHSMVTFSPAFEGLPLDEALAAIFGVDVDLETDRRRVAFIQLTVQEARQIPELSEILREEGGERAKILLTEWFARRSRTTGLNIADPRAASSILMDMIFGAVALKSPTEPSLPGGGDRRAHMHQCIQYFVHGVK